MITREQLKSIDGWLITIVFALVGLSIVAISSATHMNSGGSPEYVKKQILFFVIGLIVMMITAVIDYHTLGDFYLIAYAANLGLLLAVLIMGTHAKGAVRWINLGFIRIQPSEFAKIIMIFCLARLIDKKRKHINRPIALLTIFLFMGIPFILVKKQPDLSTSLVFLCVLVIQLYVGKISYKYIVGAMLVGIPLIVGLFIYIQNPNQTLLEPYQRERIMQSLYGDDSSDGRFQTRQSVHAIGSGKLHGKGLYNGTVSQLNYLPEPHTDFIFSVIGEEFGFTGCMAVIALLFLLIGRGIWIAKDAPDLFGKLIIAGYMGMIGFQTFVNIGVVTDLLPNTGIPLPFVSAGGSSLLANMIGIGLVLNVGMRKEKSMF